MAKVFTIHYSLHDGEGNEIYSSVGKEPVAFIQGLEQMIPAIEKEVESMSEGEKKSLTLASADAFGERDEELVVEVPRDQIPAEEVSVGDQFTSDEDGPPFTAIEVTDEKITLDANHPLAGLDLVFDVELLEVRDASLEELEHGHVHGAGGHHH
jgi:FKBP-type peptidyl-prolyl cis-trans isomerase SlyD